MANPFRRAASAHRPDADFSDEIDAHLALEADRLVAEGYSRADAVHEARRRFGNVGLAREDFHLRHAAWKDGAARQLRRAARRLARNPLFTVTAILTLAAGIGATTAVFSLVNAVLLRPLPFPHSEQLVDIAHTMVVQGVTHVDQSDATYLYYRSDNHVFSGVGAYQAASVNLSASGSGDAARATRADAARVSASVFQVLGVAPRAGRVFRDAEDLPSAAPVVVVSERLWNRQYASEPNPVGRTIMIDGVAHHVVGVMPAAFAFPDDRTQLWLPVGIDPAHTESATFDLHAIARLRDGVTTQAADADLMRLLPKVPDAYPGRLTAPAITLTKMRPVVRTLRDVFLGDVATTLWVIFAAAAFLLLVACANVANLFLVRGEVRHHELAVRRALGAGRGVIIAEFLSESALVAVIGGLLGLAVAAAGVRALGASNGGASIPRITGVGIDGAVLAMSLVIMLFVALATSLVPAIRSSAPDIGGVIGQSGRTMTASRGRHRARRAFVVVQVALGLVLVSGAGLMARSFAALRAVPPGFVPANASAFRIALPSGSYSGTSDVAELVTRALDQIAAAPGVVAAGVITKLPLDPEARRDSGTWIQDRPLGARGFPNVHQVAYASAHAFAALGVPLIQGREFGTLDPARPPMEVVVTRALARRYWGDSVGLGRHVGFSPAGPWYTVVGVTGDIRGSGLSDDVDETVYLPLVTTLAGGTGGMGAGPGGAARVPQLWAPRELAFVVRGANAGAARSLNASAARILRALAPSIPVFDARTLDEVLARSTARTSFTLGLLELASLAALLIGAVGLFGVVSYMVNLRQREMAVRLALGADPGALRRQVLGQSASVAGLGIVLGVVAAIVLSRFLASLLFGVAPRDPVTLITAVAMMALVTLGASWLPARRAAAVAPADVLRAEL